MILDHAVNGEKNLTYRDNVPKGMEKILKDYLGRFV